ncbi:sugar phosphate isomerase/epimerase family protein [Marinomonas ostreistagni]|uniref:Sugar phosphate isomerase/epimerase n=1 Tax=Marinomonas ostreistagni TaxID=359209 RepID=A0ABS0Z9G4_9GAMM|nr:sugar phosphate isomerase/epimerase [Marinomonas ostreistagni]MBJ7550291.1 sugar phosphate isomerase/epimerase [Marinomonas ostreistagni]
MSYQFSLAFLTVFDATPSEAIQIAAETGYSHVGLRLLPSGSEGLFPLMTDDRVFKETLAALQDTGIQVADIEIVRLGEQFQVSDTLAFLERGARLGAKNVLVAGDDPDESRLTASFAAFCEAADSFGLTADLEFMPWTQVPDIAKANRVVSNAAQANGGVLIDALHYHRAHMTLDDIAIIDPKRIHYVQFCDALAAFDDSTDALIHVARQARLDPGEGEIDLVSLFQAIPKHAMLSIEVPNFDKAKSLTSKERAANALAAMKGVIAQASNSPY